MPLKQSALFLAAVAATAIFAAAPAAPAMAQQTGWGQITLDNQTSIVLDLHVDGHYACRALAGLFCTSQEREGKHVCTAQGEGGRAGPFPCPIKSGESFTRTVAE
ncbi:MAG: hypothetical protein F9K19_00480 [Rhizobiaceae bacterium]|nr:MAG: hypothetical protein F9K19_00480 [Rhizobiaceae bacterium]CAG0952959.1 hypothetical protein RHIZO_00290 [Rhizobiaceae bacterium]